MSCLRLKNLSLAHCINISTSMNNKLDRSCGASEKCYAAVVYLQTVNDDNMLNIQLHIAKSKVVLLNEFPYLDWNSVALIYRQN